MDVGVLSLLKVHAQNQIDSELSVVGIDDRSLSILGTLPFGRVPLKDELSAERPFGLSFN